MHGGRLAFFYIHIYIYIFFHCQNINPEAPEEVGKFKFSSNPPVASPIEGNATLLLAENWIQKEVFAYVSPSNEDVTDIYKELRVLNHLSKPSEYFCVYRDKLCGINCLLLKFFSKYMQCFSANHVTMKSCLFRKAPSQTRNTVPTCFLETKWTYCCPTAHSNTRRKHEESWEFFEEVKLQLHTFHRD